MSTDASPHTPTQPDTEDRFVTIPRAEPGQEYVAPKVMEMPLFDMASRLAVIGMCASLPIVPLVIIVMIIAATFKTEPYLLWLWITMALLTTSIALATAVGLGREALGFTRPHDYLPAARWADEPIHDEERRLYPPTRQSARGRLERALRQVIQLANGVQLHEIRAHRPD